MRRIEIRRIEIRRLALIGVLGLLAGRPVGAHPLDPSLLEIREVRGGPVEVLWRQPAVQPVDAPVRPVLPRRCVQIGRGEARRGEPWAEARWRLDCGGRSLVGERIGVEGLAEAQTDALLRIQLADGRLIQAVLRPDAPALTVPSGTSWTKVGRDYLLLGLRHILTGPDHLLFVLGLVLLIRGRRLLWTITAFTLGHSITLSLAVLGFVRVPPAPVEILIAASILAVAVELTREDGGRGVPPWRSPRVLAFGFGLLHGLGFAGALAQVGVPAGEIPLALVSFNSGIEVGQLLFVGALFIGALLLGRAALGTRPLPRLAAPARLPAYGIGALAAYWVFERAWGLFF
jgi:hydrogenase/urease accessory protein HupE